MFVKDPLGVVSVSDRFFLLYWNVILKTKTFFTIITNKENKEALNLAPCQHKEHKVSF